MIRRVQFLAFLLAAFSLGAIVRDPPGVPARAQLPGRGDDTPAVDYAHQIVRLDFQYDQEGYVEGVNIWHGDSTERHLSLLAPAATPGPTPAPTNTPTATETVTPFPEVTPTPEVTQLPTPSETAIPKVCTLRASTTMRIRFSPSIDAAIVGAWMQGEQRQFDTFWQPDESGYLWGHSADGWSAVYWWPGFEWFAVGEVGAELCRDVQGWPWNLAPPEPIARTIRAGPHILMGEGASVVEPYAAGISAAKCLPGSYQICLKLKQANPNIWIIARPFTDHLATDYSFNPLRAWDAVRGMIPAGFDGIELENESTPPDDKLAAWVQFSIGLAELVEHDTGMQYLAFSFGPGNPPESVWPALLPYLEWVAAHPLPDGRYHGIALHAAPYATFSRQDMPWVNNLYLAGRIYWERARLVAETGFDLATWPGVLAVTEVGLSDGYSGNWDAPYSCAEAADAYRTTQAVYRAAGYPQVLIWWNFGGTFWTSDSNCATAMFG